MLRSRHLTTIAAVMLAATLAAGNSHATNESHPTAGEALMLPRFCWSQYMPGVNGPQYSISPADCGVGMNHYCDGLVELGRARKPTIKHGERILHLKTARHDTLYTIGWMKDYPACPLRGQVETTLREIESELKLYGAK